MAKLEEMLENNQLRLNVDNAVPQYVYDDMSIGKVNSGEEGKNRFSPDRLKLIMQHKKISAYKIAKETGIPTSHMYRIRDGVVLDPQISTLKKIADFLNCSVFDFMGY